MKGDLTTKLEPLEEKGVCHRPDLTKLTEDEIAPRILRKQRIAEKVTLIVVSAPLIAEAARPGQFVIVRPTESGERIPLTISDSDAAAGTITIVFQVVGRTTTDLDSLGEGELIPDLAGPLGKPSEIEKYGTVVCVGGGVGIAVLRPITKALKRAGNEIISVIGARDRSLLILEDEMRAISDELYVTTDNGSYGRKGFVSDALREILEAGRHVDLVYAIGPLPMMKAVSELTREFGVPTIVSLDPIMIDGTGMCGGCRVSVGGKTMFTCVDGPEFDGHEVDWDELALRKKYYVDEERQAAGGLK